MKTRGGIKSKNRTRDMAYVALVAVLLAVGAWIYVPFIVPFTLQTFIVFLGTYLLGWKCVLAIIVYMVLGAIGVPVFAGGQAGVGTLLGQTGGYMLGWSFIPLTVWAFTKIFGQKTWAFIMASCCGLVLCYVLGTIWFSIVYTRDVGALGFGSALLWCVLPFVLPDLLKMALAIFIGAKVEKALCKKSL